MDVKGRGNRILGACILLMMTILAVGTIGFAATAEEGAVSGSYSLVIKKEFDFDSADYKGEEIPEEVKDKAKEQTYTFKIIGTRKVKQVVEGIEQWVNIKVDETITLPREVDGKKVWESEELKSEGPFDVIVTELTDNIDIEDNTHHHYNMSGSSSDTRVVVNSRRHEVQLRNNSILTIQRPEKDGGPALLWYHVTNKPYDEHPTSNFEALDKVFSLGAGEEEKLEGLCAAIYTIEQIAAPEGYQLQMGVREETVSGSGEGRFYINGTPGRLTLTAGGTKGDGAIHYYTIDRTEPDGETSLFVERTVSIASGESYVLDNLPKGGYTVMEQTVNAIEAFKVTMPQTIERTQTKESSALTSGTTNSWKYINLNYANFDVDYIKMVSFGPLYNEKGNKLNSSTSYTTFRYGFPSDDGKLITNIKTYRRDAGYTGNQTITMSDASKMEINDLKRLYFAVTGVKSSTAKTIGVSWIEYDERETEKTFNRDGKAESITVDDRKWIKIETPALKDSSATGADQIAYYYTLKDKDGNLIQAMDKNSNLIQNPTDRAGTTIKLLPGTSIELQLSAAGSYTIIETIVGSTPIGFTMKVEGDPFGTTEAGKQIEVKVGGERTVTISKPALGVHPDGTTDNREYTFNVMGTGSFFKTVTVKAGKSETITLPSYGTYTITPQRDTLEVYKLSYTDSGAVYGTASGSSGTITFTNSFSKGEYGYRYVHEYYIRESDGTYTYEGNSQITTRLGREREEKYQALDISKIPKYNENDYRHFDEAYGWVDPIISAEVTQVDTDKEIQTPFTGEENGEVGSGEEESTDENSTNPVLGEEEGPSETDSMNPVPDGEEEPTEDDGMGNSASGGEEESDGDSLDSVLGEGEEPSDTDSMNPVPDGEEEPTGDDRMENSVSGGKEESDGESLAPVLGEGEEPSDTDSMNPVPDGEEEPTEDDRMGNSASGEKEESDGESLGPVLGEGEEPSDTDSMNPVPDGEEEPTGDDGTKNSASRGEEESDGDSLDSVTSKAEESASGEEEALDDDSSKRVSSGEAEGSIPEQPDVITEENGIVSQGAGSSSDKKILNYGVKEDKDHIAVTTGAEEIIILRYYRDRKPEGKYNVVHVYYLRDEEGDHWEGASDVLPQNGELGVKYTDSSVKKMYRFRPADADRAYTYAWDGRPQYGLVEKTSETHSENEFAGNGLVYRPNNAWRAAKGTEEGNQIIILRYYRELSKEGHYHVVHEYYVREKGEELVDALSSFESSSTRQSLKDDAEIGEAEEDTSGALNDTFTGTLNPRDGFVYTLEGITEIESVTALLGSTHTAERDNWKLAFQGRTYTYIDAGYGAKYGDESYDCNPNQQWAASTERGDEIIIFRYYREADISSNPPPTPTPAPPTPTATSTSDSSSSLRIASAETGDDSQVGLWIVLIAGALWGLVVLSFSFQRWKDR